MQVSLYLLLSVFHGRMKLVEVNRYVEYLEQGTYPLSSAETSSDEMTPAALSDTPRVDRCARRRMSNWQKWIVAGLLFGLMASAVFATVFGIGRRGSEAPFEIVHIPRKTCKLCAILPYRKRAHTWRS